MSNLAHDYLADHAAPHRHSVSFWINPKHGMRIERLIKSRRFYPAFIGGEWSAYTGSLTHWTVHFTGFDTALAFMQEIEKRGLKCT